MNVGLEYRYLDDFRCIGPAIYTNVTLSFDLPTVDLDYGLMH